MHRRFQKLCQENKKLRVCRTEGNAGRSGTGSVIGAMRPARDVFDRNLNLIIIEIAIGNLSENPLLFVERSLLG